MIMNQVLQCASSAFLHSEHLPSFCGYDILCALLTVNTYLMGIRPVLTLKAICGDKWHIAADVVRTTVCL